MLTDTDRPAYTVVEAILRPLLTAVYRVNIRGHEHIPPDGPCILVANHVSVLDGFFLGIASPRQVRFMAKQELFRWPGIRHVLVAAGAFPVDRGADAGRAIAAGVELLEQGGVVGVFPEGTSLPDQKRGYKRGAARLALATGAPLVPVALIGTELTLEPRTHRVSLPRVRIEIGEPIAVERAGVTGDAATDLTEVLERAIDELKLSANS